MDRIEHDLLGEKVLSASCYYGIQTLRAKENFVITGIPISETPSMIKALAYVKKSAAMANMELGILPTEINKAICQACDEIAGGKLHDQFVVDVFQGGAGTSTNMNANEVIANRALEIMDIKKESINFVILIIMSTALNQPMTFTQPPFASHCIFSSIN